MVRLYYSDPAVKAPPRYRASLDRIGPTPYRGGAAHPRSMAPGPWYGAFPYASIAALYRYRASLYRIPGILYRYREPPPPSRAPAYRYRMTMDRCRTASYAGRGPLHRGG